VSYKIIEEFSHSDICSDPDNQNKAKVCVFVGFDAKGDKMYDLHERRVRNGDLTTLLRLFRKSEFGARFREAEHSNTHTMSNTMIRLPNVIFSGGAVGKAPRESRSGLHILEEDMYNLLSESV